MQFQLIALTSDVLFIVPLLGRGEATSDRCVPFDQISTIERVVPANKKQRGLLLLPTSQLYRLRMREGVAKKAVSEMWISTFEPQSQLFFHFSRALHIDYQRQLMPRAQVACRSRAQRLELMHLLEKLVMELLRARDDIERIGLLDELTTAADALIALKQLFFQDRTQISGCPGLAVYLVRQLSTPLRPNETRVAYLLSIVRLLGVMFFEVQLHRSCFDLLSINELVCNLLARGVESFAICDQTQARADQRTLCEQFMDAQAAVLLAVDTMQQANRFHLLQHPKAMGIDTDKSVMLQATQAPAFVEWLPKFFKRICIAMSRVAIAIERLKSSKIEKEAGGTDEEDENVDDRGALKSSKVLTLWQGVTVLELLVKHEAALDREQVGEVLLRTRPEYIDMYLRAPRFITTLRTSGTSHLEDVALKLGRFLDKIDGKIARL